MHGNLSRFGPGSNCPLRNAKDFSGHWVSEVSISLIAHLVGWRLLVYAFEQFGKELEMLEALTIRGRNRLSFFGHEASLNKIGSKIKLYASSAKIAPKQSNLYPRQKQNSHLTLTLRDL